MRALTWQAPGRVSVETVPDPRIEQPTDAIVRITSTAICGSDLHLYEALGPYMAPGDVVGHEPMGIVVETGSEVTHVSEGDRVVVPFNISCGTCAMCSQGLQSQCETTQVREHGSGAALLGFSALYGSLPGGQAEFLRVPHADHGLIPVGSDLADERYLFLSDILPTAWQGVRYADIPRGGSVAVLGLGPVGQFAARIAAREGARVFGVDPVPERRALAERWGIEAFPQGEEAHQQILDATEGRGPDAVIDAVGMEAHGSPVAAVAQKVVGRLPDKLGRPLMERAGIDRLSALHEAIALVRRGGTISLSGVYGGTASPMPLLTMFDKQIQLRMGQCNVRSWTEDLLPLVEDTSDPLGTGDLVTHHLPLEEGPAAYEMFRSKNDNCIKVVLEPGRA
ncbi:glutathione-dependent formaldehyde dehydrogenase [Brachybacterium endophyticum]|uniref:Glutathione-dependent formaldehyde dehydrogenase n=1 Tax=Brachybacterium endophyticum TaxID=2182385 RepID=A0A2U2RHC0_9MICO|nr:zinc-dependent alcohol dehydrogenase [Brachybacterium endophyticum]PWH05269.1 glutathione-dependent formaldehyde dehydrogenase [Brachybacterium endophyticum]